MRSTAEGAECAEENRKRKTGVGFPPVHSAYFAPSAVKRAVQSCPATAASDSAAFTSRTRGGFGGRLSSAILYTCRASPSFFSAQMPYQFMSISYQVKPCRAETGCA